MVRVNFINPFGTADYNALIEETLAPYARPDTELVVTNTENAPRNIDYFYNKHLAELDIFEHVMRAESEGFDAVIIGCCYDPGVRVSRELVDIPVIGPLEASTQMAAYFGHNYAVVTDHHKAVPYLRDVVRLYGDVNCTGVRAINWWVTDMIRDTAGVARDALAATEAAMQQEGAEAVILACTIISASTEKYLRDSGATRDIPILNPNTMALKMAEAMGDLHKQGLYTISRKGYYQKMQSRAPEEFAETRARWADIVSKAGKEARNG